MRIDEISDCNQFIEAQERLVTYAIVSQQLQMMVLHECRGLALAPEVGDQQEPPRGSSTEAEISTSFIASAPTSIESLYDIERCYITQDLVSFHEAGENGVGYCVCEGRSSSIVKVLGKHVNLLQLEAAVQVS